MSMNLLKLQQIGTKFLSKRPIFSSIKIIKIEGPKVFAEFLVEKEHLNISNNLFGGFTASLVDIGGTLAIAAKEGKFGVSTDMSISFLRAANEGDVVRIESKLVKSGRNLCFTTTELYVGDDMIATGSHTKYMAIGNLT
jgi:acyl-coenzyme A thioesterase 13